MLNAQSNPATRARVGAAAAAVVLGFAGIVVAGCGDDGGGPLEQAGKAADEGLSDATDAAGDVVDDVTDSEEAQDAAGKLEDAANDTKEAAENAANDVTNDDGE